MEKLTLSAKIRTTKGKEAAKKLRRIGILPAVVYGGKENEAVHLNVNDREFRNLVRAHKGEHALIELNIEGKDVPYTVLLQEVQKHPYNRTIRHIDFHQIALDQKVKVEIALNFVGEAAGKARLETHFRKIEVECLPGNIPNGITIDISKLTIGSVITVGDLVVPSDVTILTNKDAVAAALVEQTDQFPEAAAAPVEAVAAPEAAGKETQEK